MKLTHTDKTISEEIHMHVAESIWMDRYIQLNKINVDFEIGTEIMANTQEIIETTTRVTFFCPLGG